MSGVNLLKNSILKNRGLLKLNRSLNVTASRTTKSVAPRQSLNSDYVLDIHYEFNYRDQIPFTAWDKKKNLIADVCMGITLAFVLYKCYSEPEHLFGEFEYPEPSSWSNEELGIPPIEE